MNHHQHEHGYTDIEVMHHADTDPVEGLDQWQLSDFEDLLTGCY